MKKFSFIVCASFISFASFAQRIADLELTMTLPASATHIMSGNQFTFAGTLKNNGPASILTTDTLAIAFYLDNNSQPENVIVQGQNVQVVGSTIPSTMASGASGNLNFSLSFATPPAAGSHNLCVVATAVNRSSDSVKDNTPANNKACASIVIDAPTSVAGNAYASRGLTVYPNPAQSVINFNFDVPATSEVSIIITDMTGRVVYKENTRIDATAKSTLQVATTEFTKGLYLYNITVGSKAYSGKFSVVH